MRNRLALPALALLGLCCADALSGGQAHAALPMRSRTSPAQSAALSTLSGALPPGPAPAALPAMPPGGVPPFTIVPPPPPQLPPPDANTTGNYSLSREVIRRVVWVHINQIKFCYQQALSKQPTLAGRLTALFQIDPLGRVQTLTLRDSEVPPLLLPGPGSAPPVIAKPLPLSQAPALLSCIEGTMRLWEFPPTPFYAGVTEITYPFILKPRIPDPPPGVQISDDELAALGVLPDPEPPPVDILF